MPIEASAQLHVNQAYEAYLRVGDKSKNLIAMIKEHNAF
jgi:hypothetical protein